MTRNEFKQAFALANSDAELSASAAGIFDGFGLPNFSPVHVTIAHVAELIRWQAKYLNGEWDAEALQEIADLGRKRFLILDGGGSDES